VKECVGRALSRHDCCDRIPNGLSRDDVARLEIHLDRILEHVRGFDHRVQLFLIFCRQQRRVNQTQAKRGDRASHSVRCILPPTDANARARVTLDALEVFARQPSGTDLPDGLKRGGSVLVFALPLSGLDRAGVDVDCRHIGKEHPNDRTWFILVASCDAEAAVHLMTAYADLVVARDSFPRRERETHSFGSHSDGVASGRAADRLWLCADGLKLSNCTVDQRLDAGIAWIHRRMQIEHAYDRLVPVAIFEVDGAELSPSWRASVTIGDNARASIESVVQFQLLWIA
jgi:hypothetical protein